MHGRHFSRVIWLGACVRYWPYRGVSLGHGGKRKVRGEFPHKKPGTRLVGRGQPCRASPASVRWHIKYSFTISAHCYQALLSLACVASVSNRVITRKLERKQKKGWRGSFPSPSPVIHFFLLLSQLSRRTSRGNACYAGYFKLYIRWQLHHDVIFFHITTTKIFQSCFLPRIGK